jgi:nitrate/nitrite transporter NarK
MTWMDGVNGRQWLFLTQGVPASILGIVAYLYLQDKPEDAQWLDAREKKVLRDHLEHDKGLIAGASYGSMWQMLKDPKVHTLALVYFLLLGATYTMVFWLPTLIKSWGIKDLFMIGIYAAVPSLFGVAAMVFIGRSSDRREEAPLALLLVRHAGRGGPGHHHLYSGQLRRFDDRAVHRHRRHRLGHATVLHRHTEYLPMATAAAGIALISSLGNLGAAVSPSLTGAVTAATGMYLVIAWYVVAGAIMLGMLKAAKSG